MQDWQPIETAPKDGTTVDLWCLFHFLRDPTSPQVLVLERRFINCRWEETYGTGWHFIEDEATASMPRPIWRGWKPTHWALPPNAPANSEPPQYMKTRCLLR